MLAGNAKFGWLKMLKNSLLSCRFTVSPIFVFLKTEKSKLRNPGPTTMFRPALPKVSGRLGVNASVLNQRFTL